MAFLVSVAGGPGWHSTPHGAPMGFVRRGIGMFRASPGGTCELPPGHLESLSDDVHAERVHRWVGDQGLLVVLATDGLFDPVLMAHDRGWFGDDPDDLSLGFALPPERRGSAEAVANTLMDTTRFAGLVDNIITAIARITPESDLCTGGAAAGGAEMPR